MHGLILAGGEGSRLRADGVLAPKPLVPVAGRPQLTDLVDVLRGLGCSAVTCVVRDSIAPMAATALGGDTAVRIVAVRTPTSLHSLAAGLDVVPAGNVICTMVDTVMPRDDWRRAHRLAAAGLRCAAAVVAVTPFVDDESPLWVDLGADGAVRAFGIRGQRPVATGGVYWLSEAARAAAAEALARGVERMRGYLRRLVETGHVVRTVEVARIVDVDTARDLAAARALVGAGVR